MLEQYALNEILITIILSIMAIVVLATVIKSYMQFNKEPKKALSKPLRPTPNVFFVKHSDIDYDTPTYKRQGETLSFDNF